MDVDEDLFQYSVARVPVPGTRKRRAEILSNVAPKVAKRKKKRGSGIRVTMRERLRAQRKALRLRHWAAIKVYKTAYKKLTAGIKQLTARKAGSNYMQDV